MPLWNLEHIYQFSQTESLIDEIKQKTKQFQNKREKLCSEISEKEFLLLLSEYEEIHKIALKLSGYAGLWQAENTTSHERNAHQARINDLLAEISNEVIFFTLWLKSLDDKNAKRLIESSGAYHYFFEYI